MKALALAGAIGVAVVLAGRAYADDFSGHYRVTETSTGGGSVNYDWDVSSNGPGWATVKSSTGLTALAMLKDGQWKFDSNGDTMVCGDGSKVQGVGNAHYAVDSGSMRGTVAIYYVKPACGSNYVGQTFTHTLVLSRSP
jgi:hypothetical protein